MKLERLFAISKEEFAAKHIVGNRPAIVADAIERWNSREIWTPEYFARNFGQSSVQVYDDLFSLKTISTLERYLERHWQNDRETGRLVPYVRWYAKFKPVDFVWSDEAFSALAHHWTLPYFLPDSEYILPYCPRGRTITPVLHQFPGKGIFISGAGARTRLHKDPWASDAVLCQVYGDKRLVMYGPEKASALVSCGRVVDIENPDEGFSAQFAGIEPDVEDVLKCGESLFVPAGWFHHLNSLTNAISLTWNFVAMSTWPAFMKYLIDAVGEDERIVLNYFLELRLQNSLASNSVT